MKKFSKGYCYSLPREYNRDTQETVLVRKKMMEKMNYDQAIKLVSAMFVGLVDDQWPDMEAKAEEFLFDNGYDNESERIKMIDKAQLLAV